MRLSGKSAICQFVGRGWATVEQWILEKGFPAKKILGIWESDSNLITAWRNGFLNSSPLPAKLIKNRGKKAQKKSLIVNKIK